MSNSNFQDLGLTKEQLYIIEHAQREMAEKENILKTFDPIILDLTIREPCVGTPLGHTLDNKTALYGLVKEFGFKDILLGTFDVSLPEEPQVDDYFCAGLANSSDNAGHFGFADVSIATDTHGQWIASSAMQKLVAYKIPHAIVDMDVANENLYCGDRDKFLEYLGNSIDWMYTHMHTTTGIPPRLYMNFQDFFDCYTQDLDWTLQILTFLNKTRIAAVTFEDGRGTFLPFQIGAMTRTVRAVLDKDKKLLLHLHSGNGTENAGLIEGVLNGADGIWAGFTKEAATIGHASSAEFLVNLMRVGNTAIQRYKLDSLLPTALKITNINTQADAPADFPEIGSNAYRMMLSFFEQKGDFTQELTTFSGDKVTLDIKRSMDVTSEQIGGSTGARITPVASNEAIIYQRLQELQIGNVCSPTDEILSYMRIMMRRDLVGNNRYDYDQAPALSSCYQRALQLQEQEPELISNMQYAVKEGRFKIVQDGLQ